MYNMYTPRRSNAFRNFVLQLPKVFSQYNCELVNSRHRLLLTVRIKKAVSESKNIGRYKYFSNLGERVVPQTALNF